MGEVCNLTFSYMGKLSFIDDILLMSSGVCLPHLLKALCFGPMTARQLLKQDFSALSKTGGCT